MPENLILTGFIASPLVFGFALYLFFRRFRQHKATTRRLPRLLAGNLLVLLFVCSLLVLAGEVYFRFFHDATDSFALTKTTRRWFQRHFQPNNVGFRDSVPYESHIPPGRRRITCIGDSFTAGHGVADVEDRFGNRLRRMRPEWDVHVLAQCGWDTGHEYGFLRESANFGYQFDVVVLVYCLNDIADIVPEWSTTLERIYHPSALGFFVRESYLFNTMYGRWKSSHDPDVADYYSFVNRHYEGPVWDRQQQRLTKLRDEVESRGGRLVVVTFPFVHALGREYPYRQIHSRLNEFWEALNVPQLDLLPVLQSHDGQELVVNAWDAHPNEFAHGLAAEAMVTFLDAQLVETDPSPADASTN